MRTMAMLMLGLALAGCAKTRPAMVPPAPPPPPVAYEPPPAPPAEAVPPPVVMPDPPTGGTGRPRRPRGPVDTIIRHTAPPVRASPVAVRVARVRDGSGPADRPDRAEAPAASKGPPAGYASLSAPHSMTRGQSAAVRFAVTLGGRQADATAIAAVPGNTNHQVGKVRVGAIMRAQLTGEGFTITPATPVDVDDAGEMQEAIWNWTIVPVRGPRHYIRVEAWVMHDRNGRRVRGPALRYPAFAIGVPVRWFPERASDVLDDSLNWFGRLSIWLQAATALVGLGGGFWLALRTFGRTPGPKRPDGPVAAG